MSVQRKYTNNSNLSLFAQVFLAHDTYDHAEAGLSVTTLLKPVRQVVLGRRVPPESSIIDLESEIANRVGSAVHDGFERAWKSEQLVHTLQLLGHPPGVVKRVRVNPTPEEVAAGGIIPVYTEVRSSKVIARVKVSGKFDFVGDGAVEDLKNTSVFKYMNTDGWEYVMQGSMYRLLNPEKITKDFMNLTFNFTDWSRMQQRQNPDKYPPARMLTRRYELMPLPETQAWAEQRVTQLIELMDVTEAALPLCTDKELWRSDPVFKYYKNPAKANELGARSTKNFATRREAETKLYEDGNVGVVVEKPGEVKACKYCASFAVCTQKDALIASGDLVL